MQKSFSYFHEEGIFNFCGVESKGRKKIANGVNEFNATISSLSHRVVTYVANANYVTWEGICTVTRKDGSTIPIEFCNFLHMKEGLIDRWNVYMDITKLYQN